MTSGIYRIVNTASETTYIGSSINMLSRLRRHIKDLQRGIHKNPHLQSAWAKHDHGVFTFETLIECEKPHLAAREQQFMDAYYEHDMKLYNLKPSAHSRVGLEVSAESRLKASKSNTGRIYTAEQRANISKALRGRKLSSEHRANVAAALKGRTHSAITRSRLSASSIGKIMSVEARAKMSAAGTGRKHSPETIAKMIASNTGKKRSPESCARISASLKGKVRSAEARANMRAGRIGMVLSAEHKNSISEGLRLAYKNNQRSPRTPEQCARMSIAKKGKPWTMNRREAQRKKYARE